MSRRGEIARILNHFESGKYDREKSIGCFEKYLDKQDKKVRKDEHILMIKACKAMEPTVAGLIDWAEKLNKYQQERIKTLTGGKNG